MAEDVRDDREDEAAMESVSWTILFVAMTVWLEDFGSGGEARPAGKGAGARPGGAVQGVYRWSVPLDRLREIQPAVIASALVLVPERDWREATAYLEVDMAGPGPRDIADDAVMRVGLTYPGRDGAGPVELFWEVAETDEPGTADGGGKQ